MPSSESHQTICLRTRISGGADRNSAELQGCRRDSSDSKSVPRRQLIREENIHRRVGFGPDLPVSPHLQMLLSEVDPLSLSQPANWFYFSEYGPLNAVVSERAFDRNVIVLGLVPGEIIFFQPAAQVLGDSRGGMPIAQRVGPRLAEQRFEFCEHSLGGIFCWLGRIELHARPHVIHLWSLG